VSTKNNIPIAFISEIACDLLINNIAGPEKNSLAIVVFLKI
jgi:hypothetical protein